MKDRVAEWNSQMRGRASRADEVECQDTGKKFTAASIWDKFDITKFTNAGFKPEFVAPECIGDKFMGEIEVDDISSEVELEKNSSVLCTGSSHFIYDTKWIYAEDLGKIWD